ELVKLGERPVVLEKRDKVGGIARTEQFKNFHFDMGGHRFFTKVPQVQQMWREVMGGDFMLRPRLSRIYYDKKFFYYPLKPLNALAGLGLVQSIWVSLSYLRWQIRPFRVEDTFEQWVTNRFGRRLFLTFFKTYTEKVWGISTSELKAEWAAQRIKDLSLKTALVSMFVKPGQKIKTLIEEFHYPRLGPGMMWEKVSGAVQQGGGQVHLEQDVVRIEHCGKRITGVQVNGNGHTRCIAGTDFISSMPLRDFVFKLDPAPPPEVLHAAKQIKYRDFLTVCLIVNNPSLFPDNWIYVHDASVHVGRIQNFKNWSPDMVPDPAKSSLGLEYFCNEGDDVWNMADADLVELGKREIARIGLAEYQDIEEGCVFRVEKSYPVYDSEYRGHLDTLRGYVATFENFQTVGRNGLHRYNNQDHSMLTAMLAVRNMMFGEKNDLWSVNVDQEYHEQVAVKPDPRLQDVAGVMQDALSHVFVKLDPVAFGGALGLTMGLVLFLVTLLEISIAHQGLSVFLHNLGEYMPGYQVTVMGGFVGLVFGIGIGFCVGWLFAFLRNTFIVCYMAFVQRRAQIQVLRTILDF
ncbi:MAG: NAD(P)/FAD-dependent oxidoreductase, partial [Anaerolineae bacterium]|nr:NAD(P)/FAD-dependent oxidoreductase [Anaerolineae bacterium]